MVQRKTCFTSRVSVKPNNNYFIARFVKKYWVWSASGTAVCVVWQWLRSRQRFDHWACFVGFVVLCGLDVCVSPLWLYYGLGEFPWEAPNHGEWRFMVWALSTRWLDLYLTGNPVWCLSPCRDGTGRTESGDQAHLMLSVLRHQMRVLRWFRTFMREIGSVRIP